MDQVKKPENQHHDQDTNVTCTLLNQALKERYATAKTLLEFQFHIKTLVSLNSTWVRFEIIEFVLDLIPGTDEIKYPLIKTSFIFECMLTNILIS